MSYKNTLQKVDTEKALSLIGIEYQTQGAYVKFSCPNCKEQAVIKAYGDKKNLYYCPKCKLSGHIISLVMKTKDIEWQAADLLLSKTQETAKKITQELTMKYELQYNKYLENIGLTEKFCRDYEIGVPKGKTMLAGCVAFTVKDETGLKVAYYGIKMKDRKPVFHKTFNPELYLYNLCNVNFGEKDEPVYFTTDILNCVRMIQEGKQCISNFSLPYLSNYHLELLQSIEHIVFKIDAELIKPMAIQLSESRKGFYYFE
jgi:predicted RNA-binding Zn-ribbon protein involved in translation (DUF1610 family)